ncbi:High mobility group [Coemansia sp. RSA 552]|nr:High mobility group [Coemansia sp. RSA 552]
MPQMRPYNMFGMSGLPDSSLVYDDRMGVSPAHHGASNGGSGGASGGGGGWLRIRQPIDYVAPLKKPMNSFLLYSAERRVQLRQTHPDLNTTQQSTILAREWATLPEDEKEKYRAEAKQLRDDYNARRAELSLKLQQQLNQQHLSLSLGHPPPPPPMSPHGPMQAHPPSQGLHAAGTFGLPQQQQPQSFAGANMQMLHTRFPAMAPGVVQIQPDDTFSQGQLPTSSTADQFQFETAMSSLDPTIGRNTPQTLDISTSGLIPPGMYGDRRDSKWQQELGVAGARSRNDSSTVSSQPYGILQPPSSMSQAVYDSTTHSQQGVHKQPSHSGIDGSGIASAGMLGTAGSLFDNPFDSVFQQGPADSGSLGALSGPSSRFPQPQHQSVSCLGLADIRTIPMGGLGSADSGRASTIGTEVVHDQQPQDRKAAHRDTGKAGGSVVGPASKVRGRLASPAKRSRKKSKKDPDAPKHPMSAFLYYLTSERPRLAEQLSDMSIGQQTKIIAKRWKTLDEHEKAPWEKLAKHDKDRYARERREYQGEARQSESSGAPG